MRIAWFTQRYHPVIGGAENYVRNMARRFAADGDSVDVLTTDARDLWYFTNPSRPRIDGPREEVLDGCHVRRFPIRHWFGQRYAGRLLSKLPIWRAQCRYESFMPIVPAIDRVRGDYDAVFSVAFPYTLFSHAAYLCARRAAAPWIVTPFLHLATPGDRVHRAYTRPHQARLLREADGVVAVTGLEADFIAGRGVDRAKILTLGMGVDHAEVTGGEKFALRDRLGIPRHRRAIGHLSALDPNKGSVDLIRAMQALNADRPRDPVHLLLCGASSPEFEAFEASLPEDTGRWLTRVRPWPLEDRSLFYAAIDAFAMPSRTDSYGIVFLEAWANGLPVIGAAAGGVAEVIEDGRDGLLVPFGDLDRLRAALATLADDPDRARALGASGREKVSVGYTWDDRYRTLRERVEALVRDRRSTRADAAHGPAGRRAGADGRRVAAGER